MVKWCREPGAVEAWHRTSWKITLELQVKLIVAIAGLMPLSLFKWPGYFCLVNEVVPRIDFRPQGGWKLIFWRC